MSPNTNLIINIAYLGTSFNGWQSQKSGNTVQDILIKSAQQILNCPVHVLGASRTDSGVHAWHQVAKVSFSKEFCPRQFKIAVNSVLPKSIRIYHSENCGESFHPVRQSTGKLYHYRIWKDHRCLNPFYMDKCWPVGGDLNYQELRELKKSFIGSMNFKSMCASDSSAKTFEREIFDISIFNEEKYLDMWFLGSGFLKQMIRNIVGTLIDGLRKNSSLEDLQAIIAGKDRRLGGRTAPAAGLSLARVFYDDFNKSLINLIEENNNNFHYGILLNTPKEIF